MTVREQGTQGPVEELTGDHQSQVDLEFVRQSICNCRPDKDTVTQWLIEEKARDEGVSFGDLADRLDRAGIPTLRGKFGWHRGVVGNLCAGKSNGGTR